MSMQTKEQSMGYILKALIDSGSDTMELKRVYRKLKNHLDMTEQFSFDNYTTYDNMIFSMFELKASEDRVKAVGSALYHAYDSFTVEEAGTFHDSFKVILRVR